MNEDSFPPSAGVISVEKSTVEELRGGGGKSQSITPEMPHSQSFRLSVSYHI